MVIRPELAEVKKLFEEYKTVPVSVEIEQTVTPVQALKKLKSISSHCYMLESAEDSERWGRYTFLGYDPKVEISCKNYQTVVIDADGVRRKEGSPKKEIQRLLDENKSPLLEYLPTFTGGLVGYFSYDYIKYSEPKLKLDAKDDGNFKDVDLMLFDKVVAFDNLKEKIILIFNMKASGNVERSYEFATKELEKMAEIITNGKEATLQRAEIKGEFKPLFNKEEYCKMVEKAKKYIREGDIFQVVLSNRLQASMNGSLLYTYEVLRKLNPSPYMFYFSSDDIEIAGASPETLVKLSGKTLYTYPLAGTRPRGKTKEEDEELERGLLEDPKELAEHNMLVDLGRNDLGKISRFG